jgi:hypothetical protein
MNLKSRVNDTDTDNLKKLIKKRDEVKRKMTLLKQDESIYENTFSPITKRLETISNQLQEKGIVNNFKPKEEKQETFKQIIPVENKLTLSDRISKLQKRMDSIKDDKVDLNEIDKLLQSTSHDASVLKKEVEPESFIEEPENVDNIELDELIENSVEESKNNISNIVGTDLFTEYLESFDEIPRQYISAMILDKKREFDHRTGIRHDSFQEKFFIGSSVVEFMGKDIKVDNNFYKTTPGLYELLFKNNPKKYTQNDLSTYKEILDLGNACRPNFDPSAPIRLRSDKYKSVIAPLYFPSQNYTETPKRPRKAIGKGMIKETNNYPINYVYWDDPNELVERLRLLVASQTAGHSGHNNEIVSIVEELRESGIIE